MLLVDAPLTFRILLQIVDTVVHKFTIIHSPYRKKTHVLLREADACSDTVVAPSFRGVSEQCVIIGWDLWAPTRRYLPLKSSE